MTDSTGGPRILGSLRSDGGRAVVRVEDRYDTDIDDLWTAVTDPARIARWYAVVSGDLRPGGQFQIFVEAAGLYGVGRVEVCEAPRRLRVLTTEVDESWKPGDAVPPFEGAIEATLTAEADRTRLVIETSGMPLEKIAFYGAGWQIHAENLAAYLAGRAVGVDDEAKWGALVPPYQKLAAAIG